MIAIRTVVFAIVLVALSTASFAEAAGPATSSGRNQVADTPTIYHRLLAKMQVSAEEQRAKRLANPPVQEDYRH